MIYTSSYSDIKYLSNEKKRLIDNCPKCQGTSLTCSCYTQYDISVRKVRANIPLKYRDAQLGRLRKRINDKPKLIDYINKLKQNLSKGRGLYLWGGPNTAKTYCGCAVLIEAISQGYSTFFTTLASCIDDVLMDHDKQFVKRLENVSFLLLDDIGYSYRPMKGDAIAYVDSILDKVIRERSNNLLPIILTSHKSITDMAESSISGLRVVSAITEHMQRIQF